jgi:UDP-4-amino-4,6-dideoxy-N-acetyl-beta-L-altrosamine N-acetyltransferase
MSGITFVNILNVDDTIKERVRCWRNKTAIRKRMLTQHIIFKKEHRQWLLSLQASHTKRFWVVFYAGMPVGCANVYNIDLKKKNAEWGFYIGEDDCRGKGLGKKILRKLFKTVFTEMKLRTLTTMVLPDNAIALHLYDAFLCRKKQLWDHPQYPGIWAVTFSSACPNTSKRRGTHGA